MAYNVQFMLPERKLGKSDIVVDVKQDGSVLGKLKVSQGAIEWVRRGGGKKNTHKLTWKEFDPIMKEKGHKAQ
jgi:hypothetical protein